MPTLNAVRTQAAVTIDGRLDDEVWLRAPAGQPSSPSASPTKANRSSEATELRIAYDETRCMSAPGCTIGSRRGSRGNSPGATRTPKRTASPSSSIPHHDHLTGAIVLGHAPPACSATRRSSTIRGQDDSWDAVWESAVTVDESGWSVEMRIPYSQLRFPSADRLTFGINAMRYIQRKKEQAWLVHVPKTESGLASRMGHLEGFERHRAAADGRVAAVCGQPRPSSSSARRRRSLQRRRPRVCRHRRRSEVPA